MAFNSKVNNIIRNTIICSLCVSILYACSSTKYVPKDEYLLASATVRVDAKDIDMFDLEPYIIQKANFKTFEVFKLPLFLYNLSGKDSTKWINRVLKSGGEPPVIYDSTQVDRTVKQLSTLMNNKGYLHASVTPEIKINKQKADIKYRVKSNKPTIINNYTIDIKDSILSPEIIKYGFRKSDQKANNRDLNLNQILSYGSLLKKGDKFDLDLLDNERNRIASIFRSNGFFSFGKEHIGFVADTINKENQVDLDLIIYPYSERTSNNSTEEAPHSQYIVDNIDFYVDYNPLTDGDLNQFHATDTIIRDNYRIFYGKRGKYIKPFVLLDNSFIKGNSLFNENATAATYNALSQLHILKNINIRYDKVIDADSTRLKCIITTVPDKKQGISSEIEGTNSEGSLGVGAGIGYVHRNAFRGSELFNTRIRGAYEAVSPSFSSFSENYFEIGGEASLTFPRFMFPFLKESLRRRLRASTQFISSYTYQRRPDYFTRTVFSTGLKYIWENRANSTTKHIYDFIDISYIHIPKLYPKLTNTLSMNAKIYSFTDQFIVSMGYTYSKTNSSFGLFPTARRNKSTYSFRASIESAGNVLNLISTIAGIENDEAGSKKIFGTYFAQYAKGNFDYSKTIRFDEKNAFAWRIGAGVVYPYGNNKLVPFQKRFFSGGANSVRGWNVRELGPGAFYREDSNFNDHTGDIRFDANIEYRSSVFWKLELAAFIDAGNIWTIKGEERQYKGEFKPNKFYKQIASAYGLGLRLDFDFVLIRLDCGWKLYDPADIPIYKYDQNGYKVVDGYRSKWAIKHPFSLGNNVAWHIAVGYPF